MKYLISLVLIFGMGLLAEAPVYKKNTIVCKMYTARQVPVRRVYKARITTYSPYEKGELKINHRARKITNNFGIAVPKGTLKDGTEVYIEGVGIRIVDDRIPAKSVKKHKKIAKKRGIVIDIVIDVRYNTKNIKGLRKNDLGYRDVLILGKR